MGNVHLMVNTVCDMYYLKMRRWNYVTPKSFLSYLEAYKKLYVVKYKELDDIEKNYKIGLSKIAEASVTIANMEVVLKEEEKKLIEAAEKTEKLLTHLGKEEKKAN